MANSRKTKNYNMRENYIEGNTVRKVQPLPQRPEKDLVKKKKISHNTRRNRERAMEMNVGYVLFLAVAAVATLFVCIQYLKIQSEITNTGKEITALESQLEELRVENDTEYNSIADSVDLETVRKTAIEELGMRPASDDQIIYYKNKNDDYVKQYEEVPKDGNVD